MDPMKQLIDLCFGSPDYKYIRLFNLICNQLKKLCEKIFKLDSFCFLEIVLERKNKINFQHH